LTALLISTRFVCPITKPLRRSSVGVQRWNRESAAVYEGRAESCPSGFFIQVAERPYWHWQSLGRPGSWKADDASTRQPFKARTTEELMALLSAVATAILAVIIISMLYFGRDIFVPIALAILLSFVLAPLVEILQRIRIPRGLAVVSVVVLAFVDDFRDGESSRHAIDATRRRPPPLPIDDKRKDPVLSGHKSRQGHAGARLRHVEGSQQRTG
jgi:hypothetical protein